MISNKNSFFRAYKWIRIELCIELISSIDSFVNESRSTMKISMKSRIYNKRSIWQSCQQQPWSNNGPRPSFWETPINKTEYYATNTVNAHLNADTILLFEQIFHEKYK